METISLTSAIVDCHLSVHRWIQFQQEGHSITWRSADGRSRPYRQGCPSCEARRASHSQEDLVWHAQDQIWCLNLFTPGTDPERWKDTGIQCIRVQGESREEAIKLMQEAIINTVYAFGRQEFSIQFNQEQLNKLNEEKNQMQMFIAANLAVPAGSTPMTEAVKILRQHFKQTTNLPDGKLVSDGNDLLPLEWRRD